ncbi:hypothetical protein Tco_1084408 [Tanacetum coccineum]
MGDDNPIRTLGDYSKPSHEGYKNTIELLVGNNVLAIGLNVFLHDPSPHGRILLPDSLRGKLRDLNPKESWAILEDLSLYDNESWNDPRDFTKPVKAITLPQDVPSISDRCLIELENQVQCLMEAYLASTQLTQVNKITTSCKICNGPHDTYNCMEGPEKACVDYTSSHANKIRGKRFISNQGPRSFNDAAKTWMDKPNFYWERTQTFTNPQNESIFVHFSSYQIKLEKVLLDFESNQEKSIAAISHDEKEELRKKGIKSPSKLISPKYLSPAFIKELNKNLSSPKRVHFVNSIVILSTNSDTEEEDDSSTNACDLNLGGMVKG